ncbi:MAG: Gx transporter family protein [Lachnospiraceae bacterium]|nr:Gx transporter family protein [Lachnospiraceae bacterium]
MKPGKALLTAQYGMLLALALVLSYAESQVPAFFAVPGMKLGLTNLVVLTALYMRGWKSALAVNALRIVLASVLFGNGLSLAYSLAGGLLSCLVMILMKASGRFRIVTVSAAGGVCHNIGQILTAMLLLDTDAILWYLPVLWFSGLAAGLAIGILGGELVKRLARIGGFIPAHVGNPAVIGAYEAMRRCGKKRRGRSDRGAAARRDARRANDENYVNHEAAIRDSGGYIEDQLAYGDMTYGRTTVAKTGCEIIAVFNVLTYLTRRTEDVSAGVPSLPALIAAFEEDGMAAGGHFGTAPSALADYLEKAGFAVSMTTTVPDFDRAAADCGAMLLTFYNDRSDIRQEIHTVAVTREPDGLTAHNVTGDGRRITGVPSVSALLGRLGGGRAEGISLICVGGSRQDRDNSV